MNKFLNRYNSILLSLISFLGIATSCDDVISPAEYGAPYATFRVNGSITEEGTSKVIPGIKASIYSSNFYSDISGKFEAELSSEPNIDTLRISFEDIDGIENGAYQTLDTFVVFKNPEFVNGDGNWYYGETETEFNVELNPDASDE